MQVVEQERCIVAGYAQGSCCQGSARPLRQELVDWHTRPLPEQIPERELKGGRPVGYTPLRRDQRIEIRAQERASQPRIKAGGTKAAGAVLRAQAEQWHTHLPPVRSKARIAAGFTWPAPYQRPRLDSGNTRT